MDRSSGTGNGGDPEVFWIDLVLGQGAPAELDRLRQRILEDPQAAIEMAETVQFVERMRSLAVERGPLFGCKMNRALRFAQRRMLEPSRESRVLVLLGTAAAVLLLLLWLVPPPPARERRAGSGETAPKVAHPAAYAGPPAGEDPGRNPRDARRQELVRQLGGFLEPLDAGTTRRVEEFVRRDALRSWLDPRNLVAVQRLDCELRASAARRRSSLAREGWMPEIDDRVQDLADSLAEDLPFRLLRADVRPIEVAFLVRALLASGTAGIGGIHEGDCRTAASWLRRRLPELRGGELAVALSAVAEHAAGTLTGIAEVGQEIEWFLDQELGRRAERRKEVRTSQLLSRATSPVCLGECGRLLLLAPGFGVEPERSEALRILAAREIEARLAESPDDPTLLAALAYGFADLIEDPELVEKKLRAWRPRELLGNYLTLMQLSWSREPGVRGWARFQLEMRRVATEPAPEGGLERSAFLLCLATNFAALRIGELARSTD